MSYNRFLLFVGSLTMATPFLGLPALWLQGAFLVIGGITVVYAFRLYVLQNNTAPQAQATEDAHRDHPAPPKDLQPSLLDSSASRSTGATAPIQTTHPAAQDVQIQSDRVEQVQYAKSSLTKTPKPARGLLILSAIMLGQRLQNENQTKRMTPRIKIAKPNINRIEATVAPTTEPELQTPPEPEPDPEEKLIVREADEELELVVDDELLNNKAASPQHHAPPQQGADPGHDAPRSRKTSEDANSQRWSLSQIFEGGGEPNVEASHTQTEPTQEQTQRSSAQTELSDEQSESDLGDRLQSLSDGTNDADREADDH